ncbi:GNAT family N-acetyltransferase [Noviherbaspirillum galbum]|uniref:GNAT family N-acetyltransferase n=1 Tax=Noviherbaspirillum galbum TaxID=2709383 RepID=A0A6B3STV0_9BURK|nr:GNAT family protein [Noviherbaspirillum galbum]NEX64031.1 GNAT family N-acetyltransferase [Noviherbaspirillum galbum]
MNYLLGDCLLTLLEEDDLDRLHAQKNDPEVAALLGGFGFGYSRAGLRNWLQSHSGRSDELLLAIRDRESRLCIGHVGLYKIDYRNQTCEFGIMIGDRAYWGKGIGRLATRFAVRYAFDELNMHRIELTLLATNERARALYASVGFREDGVLRQACYKGGRRLDVIVMSLLRDEFDGGDDHAG